MEKLYVGAGFANFSEELEPLLQEVSKRQQVPFGVFCSQLINTYNAKFGADLPQNLKYYSVTYACKHFGERRESGKGVRPNQSTFKTNCKARLRFQVDKKARKLILKAINLNHNHDLDPCNAEFYPENRRLSNEEETHAVDLMSLEVRPSILQNVVRTSTHKCTTLQDLRNIQQRVAKKSKDRNRGGSSCDINLGVEEFLQELEDTRKSDPGGTIIIGEKDGEVMYVFWASSQMKVDFHEFPEVIGIDSTYNTNRNGMPLTLFMTQNNHGNGRLAAICLLKDEKREILRESLQCFVDCYSKVIHKLVTIMVDKDMNEISRIWEILPNVDIHLCRFHCVEIFNRNTGSEQEKDLVRKICKKMLFTESEDEYSAAYFQLMECASDNFKRYFNKNWHNSRVVWKGHERLQSITFGLSTNNPNESVHGKFKTLMNRKSTVTQCFKSIRLFHTNFNVQAQYKEFVSRIKIHYVTNNTNPTVAEIVQTCTPFAANLIRQQLDWSLKMDALPAGAAIDTDKCLCAFYRSRRFPCAHMFFSRRFKELPLFSATEIDPKWRLTCPVVQESEIVKEEEELVDDVLEGTNTHTPTVLVPSCPVKTGGQPLTKAQKYNKFLALCAKAGNLASLCGGQQFLQRCSVIEQVITFWESNQEVSVHAQSKEDVTSQVGVCTARSSVIVKAAGPPQASAVPKNVSPANGDAERELKCRCGLQAVSFVPSFGTNKGRTCYGCPRKLPQVPCGFFSVCIPSNSKVTEEIPEVQDHQSNISLLTTEIDNRLQESQQPVTGTGAIHRIEVGTRPEERPKNLKLPPAHHVRGQPKMGKQRIIPKPKKGMHEPVPTTSDRDKRREKAAAIKDEDVTWVDVLKWIAKSQSNPDRFYHVEKKLKKSKSCVCPQPDRCVHCFFCECWDNKKQTCKHVYKIQEMYASSIEILEAPMDAESPEDDHDTQDESQYSELQLGTEDVPMDAESPADEYNTQDESQYSELMIGTEEDTEPPDEHETQDECPYLELHSGTEEGRRCMVCEESGPPSDSGAHKCTLCGKAVHAFGCSISKTGEEGSEGSDRVCWSCFDKGTLLKKGPRHLGSNVTSETLPLLKQGNEIASYHAISPNSPISTCAKPDVHEDADYHCFGCRQKLERRKSTSYKNQGREYYGCQSGLTDRCKTFLFWAPTKAVKSSSDTTIIAKSITKFFKKGQLCLYCKSVRERDHSCACPVCLLPTDSSTDVICYRCERLCHMDQCCKQIRAKEKGNVLRYICSHCSTAMLSGMSISLLQTIKSDKMLTDEHIARANAILRAQFSSSIDGLCDPLAVAYGDKIDTCNYYSAKKTDKDYVQIMNTGRKHWITAIFRKGEGKEHEVVIMDSLRNLPISGHTKIQIAMVAQVEGKITVIRPPCKQQRNSIDCGVMAIANATEYCHTGDIQYVDYSLSEIRNHLLKCFENCLFTPFPRAGTRPKKVKEESEIEHFQVYCVCRLPSNYDNMVQCDLCSRWYHNPCVGLRSVDELPEQWICCHCHQSP